MYFVGIDPSFSGTAMVILDKEGNIVKQILISTKNNDKDLYDTEKRMIDIRNKLSIIKDYDKCIVYIEGISFGSKGQGADQLAALNYFIRIFLFENNIEFYTMTPSKLKKFATGNGQAKKNLMLKEVYKRWGVDFNDDNSCDAYCLARYSMENHKK